MYDLIFSNVNNFGNFIFEGFDEIKSFELLILIKNQIFPFKTKVI